MSEFKHKANSGAVFKNTQRDNDSSPNAKGDCLIEGVAYWIAAWTNTDKNGEAYQTLKFTKKDDVHRKGMAQVQEALPGTHTPC